MEIQATKIKGLFEVTLASRGDERGFFMRTYDREIFGDQGLQVDWVQENQSLSRLAGTVRGLHFQRPPHCETKLVRALAGRLLDVAVDLRRGSPTYGMHHAVELSPQNRKCLYIPKGFAHGFCTLESDTVIAYKVDSAYAPDAEDGVIWNDPQLGINWPISGEPACISSKDSLLSSLAEIEPVQLEVEPVKLKEAA